MTAAAPVIETERLRLRRMTQDDAPLLARIFTDRVAMRHYPATKGREETARWIDWTLRCYREVGHGLWICERTVDGEFVGQCGLVPQRGVDRRDEIEIGYLLVRAHWGNGYATEAGSGARDYAAADLGLRRVVSLIDPRNAPSAAVARRVGMRREKTVIWRGQSIHVFAMDPNAAPT